MGESGVVVPPAAEEAGPSRERQTAGPQAPAPA
jgi:hypothetical protein